MDQNYQDEINKAFEKMRQDLEKQFQQLMNQTKASSDDLKKAFDAAVESSYQNFVAKTNQVIKTKVNNETLYKTTISCLETTVNEYPAEKPDAKDVYWTTHQSQVTEALKARQELLKEIISTIGSTISGAFGGSSKTDSK